MIKNSIFAIYFLLSFKLRADKINNNCSINSSKTAPSISFTENKGQVRDQYSHPRPDVLYSGTDGEMVYHIRNNGVSYQLNKVISPKELENRDIKGTKKKLIKGPNQLIIDRVDITWMNTRSDFTIQTEGTLPGCCNYYFEHCPNGVLNVKSYKGIILKNLYTNIDLHYYQKDGHLKYDYIVAPNADYRKIQMEIHGAELKLNADGSLSLKTPLGEILEHAPLVYQNGRELHAHYALHENVVSFEVEAYDPSQKLIIDPVTRVWGTYYGGMMDDIPWKIAVDFNSNVYMTGETSSSNGTSIATVGSYQATFAGGASPDAYLVKFNAYGVRQWATYYGGLGEEHGYGCITDGSGNVYVVGETNTPTSTVIATPGSYQPTLGGGFDGFLVKFDSTGVRTWATYYGGTGNEIAKTVVIDPSGYVYIGGNTSSTAGIATPGTHQTYLWGGGGLDGFLAKFTPSGVRLWGTYYGGNGTDDVNSIAIEMSGNVYITGDTNTPIAGTAIATPGSHQPTYGGGLSDAFLAKFNASGIRLWGTYYGGGYGDSGYGSYADPFGNIYIGGITSTPTSTAIATPGCHQPAFGGSYDGFLVKFDSSGVRQWGTYYGGNAVDNIGTLAGNGAGFVYVSGDAQSTGAISTPGSYQPNLSGGNDAYLVKFDSAGSRIWGTYYGSTSTDFSGTCATDNSGHIYMAGFTYTPGGPGVTTPGCLQPTFGGGNYDGFLVKFNSCSVTLGPSANANSPLCAGGLLSFTGTVSNTLATNYIWAGPNSFTSAVLSPSINNIQVAGAGSYTLTVSDGAGCEQSAILNVTVGASPIITVNSGSICPENSFTIAPMGANTYTFEGGNTVVSPSISTNYTVAGTSSIGCISQSQATCYVTVYPEPTISVNSGSICAGNSFTMVPTGASTYTFEGGSAIISPTASANFTVIGTNTAGCVSSLFATSSITVLALPLPTISVNSGTMCMGSSFTLSPSGAYTYTIEGGGIVVSPTINSSYTVAGTSTTGCVSQLTATSNVTVINNPTVTAVTNISLICVGQTATLSAGGASSYTWSSGGILANEIVSPSVTTVYTVTGTDSYGCRDSAVVTQNVTNCTGLNMNSSSEKGPLIYPNPFISTITIVSNNPKDHIQIFNVLGYILFDSWTENKRTEIDLAEMKAGIYFIKVGQFVQQVIKE